ncbi:aldehyde reductase [Acrasis kona]|uniref:Aldehyde reductase n=1 Tax=Acrasis kona TaxID=1008807 RepID=A0AAW2YRP1_9EUKA
MSHVTLRSGSVMPLLGIGTWRVSEVQDVNNLIKNALEIGYRHIDCAAIYKNEKLIGSALKKSSEDLNIDRKDLFITSKLWCTNFKKEHVRGACENTLKQLQLDYLDLYLIHWPVAFEHTGYDLEPGLPRDENNKIKFAKVTLQETWQAMEELVDSGLVKNIGVSNYSLPLLLDMMNYARIKPSVNQIEIHPYLNQNDLVKTLQEFDIHCTAYRPMAYGDASGAKLIEDPVIVELSNKYNCKPAQIVLSWNVSRGVSAVPKSLSRGHLEENFNSYKLQLTKEDVDKINTLNKNKRFTDPMKNWALPMFD